MNCFLERCSNQQIESILLFVKVRNLRPLRTSILSFLIQPFPDLNNAQHITSQICLEPDGPPPQNGLQVRKFL